MRRLSVDLRAGIDLLDGRGLRRRQAGLAVLPGRALRHVARRIEIAAPRIVDQAVLQPVLGVAAGIDGVRHQLHLGDRHGGFDQRQAVQQALRHGVDEVQHRRAGDDAVEIVRKALGADQPLAAAGRAAVPVGIGGGAAVIGGGDALGLDGRQVHGAEGVIDSLLVADGKAGERLGRRVVTGVGLGDGEALLQRVGADQAAASRTRAPRPRSRHCRACRSGGSSLIGRFELEADLRLDQAAHAAMLGHAVGFRHDAHRDDRGLGRREVGDGDAAHRRLGRRHAVVHRRIGGVGEAVAVLRQRA